MAALQAERAAEVAAPAQRRHPGRLRNVGATLVLVLGCVLAPLSVVSVWLATQVTNTDAYVETVAPVIDDPRLQKAMADQITAAVFTELDVEGVTTQALSALVGQTNLPPPLAGEGRGAGRADHERRPGLPHHPGQRRRQPRRSSPSSGPTPTVPCTRRWSTSSPVSRAGPSRCSNGAVSIDLAPFIDLVKTRLVDRGITVAAQIPEVHKSFVIYQSDTLAKNVAAGQTAFSALSTLGTALPIVTLVVLAGGVLLGAAAPAGPGRGRHRRGGLDARARRRAHARPRRSTSGP